jgi:hypothetical protein
MLCTTSSTIATMDSSEQSSGDLILPRLQLRFSRKVLMRRIPRACDYSPEEIEDLWIQRSDLDVMRQQFMECVDMVVHKELLEDTDEYCIRGTEIGVPKIIEPRQKTRRAAIQAVLEEYALQKAEGDFDPEIVRSLYRHYTVRTRTEAHRQGLQDFEDTMESIVKKKKKKKKKKFADTRPSSPGCEPRDMRPSSPGCEPRDMIPTSPGCEPRHMRPSSSGGEPWGGYLQ